MPPSLGITKDFCRVHILCSDLELLYFFNEISQALSFYPALQFTDNMDFSEMGVCGLSSPTKIFT